MWHAHTHIIHLHTAFLLPSPWLKQLSYGDLRTSLAHVQIHHSAPLREKPTVGTKKKKHSHNLILLSEHLSAQRARLNKNLQFNQFRRCNFFEYKTKRYKIKLGGKIVISNSMEYFRRNTSTLIVSK